MLERNPWSPSSEAHVIISQLSSLKDLPIDMTSLWEHHASPSGDWASAEANAGVLVCDGWHPAGSPCFPALTRCIGLSFDWLQLPGLCILPSPACCLSDLEQVSAASGSPGKGVGPCVQAISRGDCIYSIYLPLGVGGTQRRSPWSQALQSCAWRSQVLGDNEAGETARKEGSEQKYRNLHCSAACLEISWLQMPLFLQPLCFWVCFFFWD